ncbi:hypothetical protein LSAT2_008777 [Lamellibrachia satsuma]|nr:hypothetical protein LSAT2_008777 [Lamellibrachia satsuma]
MKRDNSSEVPESAAHKGKSPVGAITIGDRGKSQVGAITIGDRGVNTTGVFCPKRYKGKSQVGAITIGDRGVNTTGVFCPKRYKGEPIKCYVYTSGAVSIGQSDCQDPFNKKGNMTTCLGVTCMKSVIKSGNSLIMTRGCLPTALDNGCKRTSAGGTSTVLCYCNSDRCNGASSGPSVFIVVFFVAMIARWL